MAVIVARTLDDVGALRRVAVFEGITTLLAPVSAAHGTHRQRRLIYVAVETATTRGFGELATVEVAARGDETTSVVLEYLVSTAIPKLLYAASLRPNRCLASHGVVRLFGASRREKACASVLEMALLDAELRMENSSLASWLQIEHRTVLRGATLSGTSLSELGRSAEEAVQEGAVRLRAKITPSDALATAQHLRECTEAKLTIQLDANGSFDLSDTSVMTLQSLKDYDAALVEQPLAGHDLTAMAHLREQVSTRLALDETISTVRGIADVARYGAADAVCIKPVRFGGVRGALSAITEASQQGLDVSIGGMFESGLGRSVIQTLSNVEGVTLISDTSPAVCYLATDPCQVADEAPGDIPLWGGSGLGPWPEQSFLRPIASFDVAD